MAVVDDLGQPGMGAPPPSEDYGRQPPQDMAAEQSVLGGMLLSKDAIADVLEKLRPGDFYRPAHQNVYDAILDLYGRGEPADAVTVSAELDRRGLLKRIGGAPYLHTLISTVPTAANAGYYAGIVAEKALLRRLVEAGTRVVQYGYAGAEGADVAEVVDRAQAEMYEVTDRRNSEDFVALEDLLQPTMDEIDAIASSGGMSRGVPTGFTELDEVTNGLHPGQMIIVAARPGVGKALALNTPLPTPTGWTTMGDVAVGDLLLDGHGLPTTIMAATDVMLGRPCYEIEFSDGTVIVADEQHQWPTAHGVRITSMLRAGADTVTAGARPSGLGGAATLALPRTAVGVSWIRRVATVPVRCVEVDNSEHLYLAGAGMVPTHNSTLGLDFMRSALDQEPVGQRHLLAGNEQVRDRDAAAVGRGEDQARRHAFGSDERRRLDAAGPADERDQRSAAVHRRFAEPDDDGDPGQGAPAAPEGRPAADRRRLHAADDVGQEVRIAAAGGLGVLPKPQADGQGTRGSRGRDQPAEPWSGTAHRQEADGV